MLEPQEGMSVEEILEWATYAEKSVTDTCSGQTTSFRLQEYQMCPLPSAGSLSGHRSKD